MGILVFSTNGKYTTKTTLEEARVALDCANKTVVVTSALTGAQSNITGAWPSDRALRVEKGGSINPSTAFIGLKETTPEMFGSATDATLALSRAAAALSSGGILLLNDTYTITTGVTLLPGTHVTGRGGIIRGPLETTPMFSMTAEGDYRIADITLYDGGSAAQAGMIQINNTLSTLVVENVTASYGYAGVWAKGAKSVRIVGGDFSYCSHNIYLGDNITIPVNDVTYAELSGVKSHHALTGGDGLKTVSRVKRLQVIGGEFHNNAQDGMDLFAGCEQAEIIGAHVYSNGIQGFDIKTDDVNYPVADWGKRKDISISNCDIRLNGEHGIKVWNEASGDWVCNTKINNNTIAYNAYDGLFIRAANVSITNNIIYGNGMGNATTGGRGIYLLGAVDIIQSGAVITGNTIYNNGRASGATAGTGILVNYYDDVLITGNSMNSITYEDNPYQYTGVYVLVATNIMLANNTFGTGLTKALTANAGTTYIGQNLGLITRTTGQSAVPSGTTTAAITHGLPSRPNVYQISLVPSNSWGNANTVYPSTTSTTTFTLNTNVDPGAVGAWVFWVADLSGAINPYLW